MEMKSGDEFQKLNGSVRYTEPPFTDHLYDALWHPNADHLLSASLDGFAMFWDIKSVRWNPFPPHVLPAGFSYAFNKGVSVFDSRDQQVMDRLCPSHPVVSVGWSHRLQQVIPNAAANGRVTRLDLSVNQMKGFVGCSRVCFVPDKESTILTCKGNVVYLWDYNQQCRVSRRAVGLMTGVGHKVILLDVLAGLKDVGRKIMNRANQVKKILYIKMNSGNKISVQFSTNRSGNVPSTHPKGWKRSGFPRKATQINAKMPNEKISKQGQNSNSLIQKYKYTREDSRRFFWECFTDGSKNDQTQQTGCGVCVRGGGDTMIEFGKPIDYRRNIVEAECRGVQELAEYIHGVQFTLSMAVLSDHMLVVRALRGDYEFPMNSISGQHIARFKDLMVGLPWEVFHVDHESNPAHSPAITAMRNSPLLYVE